MKPTLLVHTTYFPLATALIAERSDDPERAEAARLGTDLYHLLTRPLDEPYASGARIPVRVATRHDRIDLDEAEHVVIVPVLGTASLQRLGVRGEAVRKISDWSQDQRRPLILPVLTSKSWRAMESQLAVKPLLTELYAAGEKRRSTLEEIVLALLRRLHPDGHRDHRLFISHAKADLAATGHAAEELLRHVTTATTGAAFFDRVSLRAGEDLGGQIDDAASAGMLVVIRSDSYSSRSWCQRELLRAKSRRLPTLTVEVLKRGERRSLAYGGNGPTVVWDGDAPAAAAHVALLAHTECLRHALFHAEAKRVLQAAELSEAAVVMARPPELLDLAVLRRESDRARGPLDILHPDPELSVDEQRVLVAADRHVRLLTPTSALTHRLGGATANPLDGLQLAMSLSKSPDAGGPDGYLDQHIEDATLFVAQTLIASGASIGYGGDLRDNGFTKLLCELIVNHNQTAHENAELLHDYLAAHIDWQSVDLPITAHSLGDPELEARIAVPPGKVSPARGALLFSDMRRVMETKIGARVVLGGKTRPKTSDNPHGYGGRYPGLIEEAWRSLSAGHPLYVAGGFGGAAALLVQVLESDSVPEQLREHNWQDSQWHELVAELEGAEAGNVDRLGLPRTQEAMVQAIRQLAKPHLTSDEQSLEWNGLTLAENRQLFHTRDPLTIATLILRGLLEVTRGKTAERLRIELVRGDITDATGLDLLAFPVFSDVESTGAGAAIDHVSDGAATRARQGVTAIGVETIGADFLFAADLGEVNAALDDISTAVEKAASSTVALARRHGLYRIGVVTFLGNTVDDLAKVVDPMLQPFSDLEECELIWFENDEMRFERLRKLLGERPNVALTTRVARALDEVAPMPTSPPSAAGPHRTVIAVREGKSGDLDVSVLLPHGNGVVPNHTTARPAVPTARPSRPDALQSLGEGIAKTLFLSGATERAGIAAHELVIAHDAAGGSLPYEALCVQADDGSSVCPALEHGIVRQLVAPGIDVEGGVRRPTSVDELRVLVIVDPRNDLPSAGPEAERLLHILGELEIQATVLRHNEATVKEVRAQLASGDFDVLHYAGHGFYRGPEAHESGLVLFDAELTPSTLTGSVRFPRVAFANACEVGRVRAPSEARHTFAEVFLRGGVDAYIGTFWQVADAAALEFARVAYESLAAGAALGAAVIAGRRHLNRLGHTDWANYLLYGNPDFRLRKPQSSTKTS